MCSERRWLDRLRGQRFFGLGRGMGVELMRVLMGAEPCLKHEVRQIDSLGVMCMYLE